MKQLRTMIGWLEAAEENCRQHGGMGEAAAWACVLQKEVATLQSPLVAPLPVGAKASYLIDVGERFLELIDVDPEMLRGSKTIPTDLQLKQFVQELKSLVGSSTIQ